MNILAALAADPNVSALFRRAVAPQQFRANCGRRLRVYLSASDARACEAGFDRYPMPMPDGVPVVGPFADGFFDAEQLQMLADEARQGDDE